MSTQLLSRSARHIENQFALQSSSWRQDDICGEAIRQLEGKGVSPSDYDVYLVRRNQLVGDEVVGPKTRPSGKYSEEVLYGAAGSPILRFLTAIQALRIRAERAAMMDPEEVEFGHQAALFWAEVGRLKELIGVSPVISEIVAEFRTARFCFLGKDTPRQAIQAMAAALQLVAASKRLDTAIVDRVVEILEAGGIDSLALDALRDSHG